MDSVGVQVGLLLAVLVLLERLAAARGWGGLSAAGIGLLVTAAVIAATPFATAYVIRPATHYRPVQRLVATSR
jgi:hypothetical protein